MEFLYSFANASLTQRVLIYLLRQLRTHIDCVTLFFLNDRWVLYIKLNVSLEDTHRRNCWAMLNENGFPYQPTLAISLAIRELEAGNALIPVMHRHKVMIVSHGAPSPDKIYHFRDECVEGLGYCPQSLA